VKIKTDGTGVQAGKGYKVQGGYAREDPGNTDVSTA